ncbi:hypothetical protein [Dactylosporangium sp. NPDC051484]
MSKAGLTAMPTLGARPVLDRVVLALFLMPQAILAAYFVRGGRVA